MASKFTDCYDLAKKCGLKSPPEYLRGKDFVFKDALKEIDIKRITDFVNGEVRGAKKCFANCADDDDPGKLALCWKLLVELAKAKEHRDGSGIISGDDVKKCLTLIFLGRQCAMIKSELDEDHSYNSPKLEFHFFTSDSSNILSAGFTYQSDDFFSGNANDSKAIGITYGMIARECLKFGDPKAQMVHWRSKIKMPPEAYLLGLGVEEERHSIQYETRRDWFLKAGDPEHKTASAYRKNPTEVDAAKMVEDVLRDFGFKEKSREIKK